jgi:SAM-dependent methyltransferase
MTHPYDRIGIQYRATRREDERIARFLWSALGDAQSVVNVGAGAGAYEPTDREVVAVEPSATMIAQRPPNSAPVIQAVAESIPLASKRFDTALAINTLHHWADLEAGLGELRRLAKRQVLMFLRHPAAGVPFWLTEKYFQALDPSARMDPIVRAISKVFPNVRRFPFHLPQDCHDGLFTAFWARPEAYLDPNIRANMSNFALQASPGLESGLERLEADLRSGAWDRAFGQLRTQQELNLGHLLLVASCE